jgi:hypothetical protein
LNTAGKRERRQATQSEAGGGTALAADEAQHGDDAAIEAAGTSGGTAPETETKPAEVQAAPFTTSA